MFDGSAPFSVEDDDARGEPANAYGASKRAAEAAVRASWPAHAILRPSVIFGPPPPGAPVARPLFLQWLDAALAAGPIELFEDEFRNPIYVADIVAACEALLGMHARGEALEHRTFNFGGPERCVARACVCVRATARRAGG